MGQGQYDPASVAGAFVVHAGHGATGVSRSGRYLDDMDLMQWIGADLADVRQRMYGAVVKVVPKQHWGEPADGGGSSLFHLLLHVARHQDLALSTAIRNKAPLFDAHRVELGLAGASPIAGIPEREDTTVTTRLHPDALLAYVTDVFDTTERWLSRVASMALDTIPPTSRRLTVRAGITTDDAAWLHDMWKDKTVAWLVRWPIVGHGNAHVGEMISVRNRLGYSPF